MDHFLFAAYLILFAWLVTKTRFFTATGLTTPQLVILFLIKVMAAILYGWIGVYYGQLAQMMDTWAYHYESLNEYELLKSNPVYFFTNILHSGYADGYGGFLEIENSWWNDIKAYSFIKLLALFNLLSFGNYYINAIFYSFISLFGAFALYRVMNDAFPGRKVAVLLATFFVPSVLYWTSGLHKDGLIFVGLAFTIYHVYFGLKEKRFSALCLVSIILGLLPVLVFRNFLILPTLPALFTWIIAARSRWKPLFVFAVSYTVFVLVFFTAKFISPRLNFPETVVERQAAFVKLGGGSAVAVKKLEPTFGSFVTSAPQALALSTIRPYPSDVRHLLSLAAAVEINFLLLVFLVFLIWRRKDPGLNPFVLFCLFFSFSVLMMIGYSVNVLGAIVRYRSVVLSLLVAPMMAMVEWRRVGQVFLGNIVNRNNV